MLSLTLLYHVVFSGFAAASSSLPPTCWWYLEQEPVQSAADDQTNGKPADAAKVDATKVDTTKIEVAKPEIPNPDEPSASKAVADIGEASPLPTLSPEEITRKARIAKCLSIYYQRPVNADELRPWSIMHGLIAYGRDSQIVVGGQRVNAAEYLCANGVGNGMQLLYLQDGQLRTRIGPGVQGHPGQFLAILAQSNVPVDQPITVEGKSFTVRDLIEFEKKDCHSGTELTFKLIGLAHYLEPGEAWTNDRGELWNMPRLIREELTQPIHEGACGGTHRLMSFSFAVMQVEKYGHTPAGERLRAARLLDGYSQRAWRQQNSDGSFSTEFFEGAGADPDKMRRLYATGHILEWLSFTLPREKLLEPRATKAVDYLLDLMLGAPGFELDVGPRGHAIHALAMYELNVFGTSSDFMNLQLAADDPALIELERVMTKAEIAAAKSTTSKQRQSNNATQISPRQGRFRRR